MSITLIEYQPRFQADFYRLNEAWIAPHFGLEEEDIQFLQNPQREILDKGGMIFFAVENCGAEAEKVLGTAGLLRMDEDTLEMVRVAVNSSAQGLGLGKQLIVHAINWAKQNGARQVILESSSKPINARAVALYEKLGFQHYQPKPEHRSALQRADVFMHLSLASSVLATP
jgi:GNAT superfamily N-acetyltransferase